MLSSRQGVGKSCLAMRYVRGTFDAASRATVGAAFLSHTLTLPDGAKAKLEIWDTAGQERCEEEGGEGAHGKEDAA